MRVCMRIYLCTDMRVDMCVDMCVVMCTGVHTCLHLDMTHVCRHVSCPIGDREECQGPLCAHHDAVRSLTVAAAESLGVDVWVLVGPRYHIYEEDPVRADGAQMPSVPPMWTYKDVEHMPDLAVDQSLSNKAIYHAPSTPPHVFMYPSMHGTARQASALSATSELSILKKKKQWRYAQEAVHTRMPPVYACMYVRMCACTRLLAGAQFACV